MESSQRTVSVALAAKALGLTTQAVYHLITVKRFVPVTRRPMLLDVRDVAAYGRLRRAGVVRLRRGRVAADPGRWYESAETKPV